MYRTGSSGSRWPVTSRTLKVRRGKLRLCRGRGGRWRSASRRGRGRIKLFMTGPSLPRPFLPSFVPHSRPDGISIIADGSSPRRPPAGAPFDDFGDDVHGGGHRLQQQQHLHHHQHHQRQRQQSPRCQAQQAAAAAAAAAASASNFCTMRRTGASGVLNSGGSGGRRAVQFADQPLMQQTRKNSVSETLPLIECRKIIHHDPRLNHP